ncbi:MAG: hypothetical protein A2Z88_11185 [Omnitrophica WOR_2 bacterium GWA2_47_8]|nr:MAG: hypothetical protein A2Z88_11185 [Omnitrophica WOR_2 bacterium GWA2_47_8]
MRDTLLIVLKFFGFLLIVPILIATTVSFSRQLNGQEILWRNFFTGGMVTYVVIHLFFFQPRWLYDVGQKSSANLFRFSAPLAMFMEQAFPVYTFLLLVILKLVQVFRWGWFSQEILIFFIGFSLAMHVIHTAQTLNEGEFMAANPQYLLTMSLIFIFNIFLVSFLFYLIFPTFSFPDFARSAANLTRLLYSLVFKQLFSV